MRMPCGRTFPPDLAPLQSSVLADASVYIDATRWISPAANPRLVSAIATMHAIEIGGDVRSRPCDAAGPRVPVIALDSGQIADAWRGWGSRRPAPGQAWAATRS